MGQVYVAMSPAMQEWGGDVGISKHIYKVAYTDDAAEEALAALNTEGYAGLKDWELLGARELAGVDADVLASRLKDRHKLIDPLYYPRIKGAEGRWEITQLPEVEGGFVALDPRDGAIRALVGGFDFYKNKFNHASQAWRQPGSSFKPFIYSAALERGFTPATIINDAPLFFDAAATGSQPVVRAGGRGTRGDAERGDRRIQLDAERARGR